MTNNQIIEHMIACECKPHKDIKTFKKWIAEGRSVKKGEKAIKLHAAITKKDEDGKEETKIIQYKACVFCRCQTKPTKADK